MSVPLLNYEGSPGSRFPRSWSDFYTISSAWFELIKFTAWKFVADVVINFLPDFCLGWFKSQIKPFRKIRMNLDSNICMSKDRPWYEINGKFVSVIFTWLNVRKALSFSFLKNAFCHFFWLFSNYIHKGSRVIRNTLCTSDLTKKLQNKKKNV